MTHSITLSSLKSFLHLVFRTSPLPGFSPSFWVAHSQSPLSVLFLTCITSSPILAVPSLVHATIISHLYYCNSPHNWFSCNCSYKVIRNTGAKVILLNTSSWVILLLRAFHWPLTPSELKAKFLLCPTRPSVILCCLSNLSPPLLCSRISSHRAPLQTP